MTRCMSIAARQKMCQTAAAKRAGAGAGFSASMLPFASLPLGAPSRQCQWIENDPTPDESCKCLAPVARRKDGRPYSYCPAHVSRVIDWEGES